MRPPLVLVGHGSRDPRSAATLHRLAQRVRAGLPQVDVRGCASLELSVPNLEHVLSGLDGSVIVVPLLLGDAYHARTAPARPGAPGRCPTGQAQRMDRCDARRGPRAARRRPAPGCPGSVLATDGSWPRRASSHGPANAAVSETATDLSREAASTGARWLRHRGAGNRGGLGPACATPVAPTIGVLPWFLAPGRLLDRAEAQAAALGVTTVTAPLADHPATARVPCSPATPVRWQLDVRPGVGLIVQESAQDPAQVGSVPLAQARAKKRSELALRARRT